MKRFFKAITYWFRYLLGMSTDAISDPIRDSKYQIEDAEAECEKFESHIARFIASKKATERELIEARKLAKKWENTAIRAAEKNKKDDARAALRNQVDAEQKIKLLEEDLNKSNLEVEDLKRQLELYESKINRAKNNSSRFAARLESANIRSGLSGQKNKLNNAFSSLDELERQANSATDMADAYEEINPAEHNLITKYEDNDAEFEERLTKLIGKNS